MDLTTTLSVIGITITVFFGIWGVYVTIKNYKPGEVTFIKEELIPLFDSLVKNVTELSITYKEEPVKPNLFLLKGAFINSGKKDISPNMVENPIKMVLPEKFKWLSANVVSLKKNVIAVIKIVDDCSIEFETGLFKTGEYIRFQALVEAKIPEFDDLSKDKKVKKFEESIKFNHRIEDVRDVKRQEVYETKESKKRFKRLAILATVMIMFAILVFLVKTFSGSYQKIVYENNVNKEKVYISSIKNNLVYYEYLNTNIDGDELELEYFNEDFTTTNELKVIDDFSDTILYIFLILYIILPIGLFSLRYMIYRKNTRIIKLLLIE